MTPYEIVLAIIQVIVIGAIIALTRRFGKQFPVIVIVVILVLSAGAVIYHQLTKEKPIKEMSLNELFDHYADSEQHKQCEGKPDACKEFYIGQSKINNDPQMALRYFLSAYEHNVSGLIDDPDASEANLTTTIAELYRQLEPDHIWAQRFYEKSITAGAEENLCVLGEMLMDDKNISKAREYLIRGDAKNLSACSSHLGAIYFEEKNEDAIRLWLKAYLLDPYGKEVNYYLGNLYVHTGKLQQAKYHFIIALKQFYKTDHIDIYDRYETGIKLKEIDASPLFVERILQNGKFNIDHLKRWFEIVMNRNNDWKPAREANTFTYFMGDSLTFTGDTIIYANTTIDPTADITFDTTTINGLYDLLYGQTPSDIEWDQREKLKVLEVAIKTGNEFNYNGILDGNFTYAISYTPKSKTLLYEIGIRK